MKRKLENLRNLFSNDNNVMYRALLAKKDLILQPFYVVASIDTNRDIEDILERRIRFKKVYLDPDAFLSDEECKKAFDEFNNQFRVLYLYNEIPFVNDESDFIIKYDFRRLSDREYKILFANFYPSLDQKSRYEKEEDPLVYLLKQAMDERLGDASLILGLDTLVDSCFACDVISEIIIPPSLHEGYRIHLKLLSEKMHLEVREVNYD